MSVIDRARTAYHPANQTIRSPRGIEYEAFARVSRALKSAAKTDDGMKAMAGALHDNRRLWTLVAASVADPVNELPAETRASLFYLAEFTVDHSRKVLRGEASIDALVDVNAAMMAGLRATPEPE